MSAATVLGASAPTGLLQSLSVDDCLRLLASQYLGRVAFLRDGVIEVRPVNYVLDRGSVVFRTDHGSALDAIVGSAVAFEVDQAVPSSHAGWSVVVHGKAEEIWQPEELDHARNLLLRPWAPGERSHYVRILSSAISGRRIT